MKCSNKSICNAGLVLICLFIHTSQSVSSSSNANGNIRIAGEGQITGPNAYPWMVYLELLADETSSTPVGVCGGTLINDQWVLTAAVCLYELFDPTTVRKINVYLGAHNIVASSEEYRVKYTSENFFSSGRISLIKLPNAISFTDQIRPISLPPSDENNQHVNDSVFLLGWGARTESDPSMSQYLRRVDTTVMNNTECAKTLGLDYVLTDYTICSKGNDSIGTCLGDFGGPLLYQEQNGNNIQLGVADSYLLNGLLFGGCSSGYPSEFVRVSKYVDWINTTINSATALIAQSFNSILLTALAGIVLASSNFFL